MFPAGAVTIGVEYRRVDVEVLNAGFGADFVAEQNATIDTSGVSLHVLGTEDGQEYLRFDCFDEDPHYHYILWGTRQTIVPFDIAAGGDMLTWALAAISDRLDAMLKFAGAPELAAQVDRERVRAALDDVAPVAIRAQQTLRKTVA